MNFSWDGRYILRRINEDDPRHHRIYVHSERPGDITEAYTSFSSDPATAAKSKFDADRVDATHAWPVSLGGGVTVDMGVFMLRRRP